MKQSQRMAEALGLDLVQKAHHGSELRLYKDNLVVTLRAEIDTIGPPKISIASIERTQSNKQDGGLEWHLL